ncbi:MAG: hypothetical protein KME13_18430 [Myxacorys californica WJT36-NPBG1]|jgi:hypothetical protein|nr:hypothetical protein [Myxacorys californica WJT36-NPBG1]
MAEIILKKLEALDPAPSINDSDVLFVEQEGTSRKATVNQVKGDLVRTSTHTAHTSDTSNPHSVTAAQVGNTTAQWNADKLQGQAVSNALPEDKQYLKYDFVSNTWKPTSENNVDLTSTQTITGTKAFNNLNLSGTLSLTNALSITSGGTGANTQGQAQINLGLNPDTAQYNATKLQSVNLSSTTPTDKQYMKYDSATSSWKPTTENNVDLSSTQTITGAKTFNSNLTIATGNLLTARKTNIVYSGNTSGDHTLAAICTTGSGDNVSAFNAVSGNPDFSAVQFTGQEYSHGTLKIAHEKPVGADNNDAGSSALSIDLKSKSNGQTAAQGIFLNTSDGTTSGNYLTVRSNGTQLCHLTGNGRWGFGIGFSTPTAKMDVKSDSDTLPALILAPNSSSSTANILEIKRGSDGAVRSRFDVNGQFISNSIAFFAGSGVQFGSTSTQFGGGGGVIGITNATTAPTTNPTNGVVLFANNGTLKFLGTSGTAVDLAAPYNLNTAQFNANKLQGTSVSSTAPTDGQYLKYDLATTSWRAVTEANVQLSGTQTITGAKTFTSNLTLSNSNLSVSNGSISVINGGLTLGTALTVGNGGTGATTASAARTALGVDPATAQYNANKIQGRNVSSTAPADKQVLQYSSASSQYEPAFGAGGKVLQVKYMNQATSVVTTSSTFIDTGVGLTITPQFASSEILILVSINGVYQSGNTWVGLRLQRRQNGGTYTTLNLIANDNAFISTSNTGAITSSSSNHLDSDHLTGLLEYRVFIANTTGVGSVAAQVNSASTSTITLMEIAA